MDISGPVKKILCIDDDPNLSTVVKGILDPSLGGARVQFYQSGTSEEGLQRLRETRADIVLCNIQLNGMDGFEVCREIRKQYPQCAVILMSDYAAEQDYASKASEAGADSYLSKPIKRGELLFVVNFVMRVAQLNNAVYEKNKQLEESLEQLKLFHKKVAGLNEELQSDKRRLGSNLREMTDFNVQLEEKNAQISSMVEELGHRFESTEALLASIIELHQVDHRGHSERVAEISTFIAEKMNLSEYQIRNVKTAARLHELGIVALPTPEKRIEAADEKRNRMRTNHPLVGEMLLKGFPGFELIATIIRHLHENVDGSGSPDGLYGDRIPIGARIVSAVSYFDHSRVSNPNCTPADTFAVIDQQSGTVFDETVLNYLNEYVETRMHTDDEKSLDCSVFALVEGMQLASDIYSESGINLLRKGTVLNRDTLNKIIKFHAVDPIAGNIKIKQPS